MADLSDKQASKQASKKEKKKKGPKGWGCLSPLTSPVIHTGGGGGWQLLKAKTIGNLNNPMYLINVHTCSYMYVIIIIIFFFGGGGGPCSSPTPCLGIIIQL